MSSKANELKKGQKIYITSKSSGDLVFIDEIIEVNEDIAITKQLTHLERHYDNNIFCTDAGTRKLYNFNLETPELKAKNQKQILINSILNKTLSNYTFEQLKEVSNILK